MCSIFRYYPEMVKRFLRTGKPAKGKPRFRHNAMRVLVDRVALENTVDLQCIVFGMRFLDEH